MVAYIVSGRWTDCKDLYELNSSKYEYNIITVLRFKLMERLIALVTPTGLFYHVLFSLVQDCVKPVATCLEKKTEKYLSKT